MIVPPFDGCFPGPPFLRYLSASWHIIKVPTESMSITAETNQKKETFSYKLLRFFMY